MQKTKIAKTNWKPIRRVRVLRNPVSLREVINTTTFMDLVILTMTVMGSWTLDLGKNLLGKIQSNLQNLKYGAWTRGEQKIKKQQRHEDEQNITEEIIKQSEWEVFSKEEEQSHTQPGDRMIELDKGNIFSDLTPQTFKHKTIVSKVAALVETNIEEMTGSSNGIITWNQGNVQAMVKVDNLLIKLGRDPKQPDRVPKGQITVTSEGFNPMLEAEMIELHKDLQHGQVAMEEEQYPSS